MPVLSNALSGFGRSPLNTRSPNVSPSMIAMSCAVANATISRLARVGDAIAERVVAGGVQNDRLERCFCARPPRAASRSMPCLRHVRHLECAHVQRLERLQDLVTARTLDRDDVARRWRPPGCSGSALRSTPDVTIMSSGRAGRALAEHETGDLPAQPEVAARILVADRIVGEGRQREANRSIQAVHRQQRGADDGGTEIEDVRVACGRVGARADARCGQSLDPGRERKRQALVHRPSGARLT